MTNHLDDNHWRVPGTFKQSMTTRQLRETLLTTNGTVFANGEAWEIKHDKLGVGVVRVWLEKKA